MGRFYSGDISGKFWFGVQNSDDASHFGLKHTDIMTYHVCGCTCESMDRDTYCTDCYSSFEEHVQAINDDDCIDDICDNSVMTCYVSECEICYEFEKQHLEIVEERVRKLENIVGQYMSSYKIVEKNGDIQYDIDDDIIPTIGDSETLMYIARLCLGKQILYCLQQKGQCHFYAEC